MSTVLKLLRLQIDNKYDFFKKTKRKTFKSFGGYAVVFALIFAVTFFLSRKVISYLQINMNQHFFAILFAVNGRINTSLRFFSNSIISGTILGVNTFLKLLS